MIKETIIANSKDRNIRKTSSSGGAFTELIKAWFDKDGKCVVYGCKMNKNLDAVHYRATSIVECEPMRGSKYIGSNVIGINNKVLDDLKLGYKVLFSGTPCQCASLKKYLAKNQVEYGDNLLLIDFVCHGVGDNGFFKDYVRYLEKKYKSKAVKVNFRAKSKPGRKQDMEISFENGKKYNASSTKYDWFYSIYLKNLILKPSCYSCKFTSIERESDITLADYWNSKTTEEAKSLILVSTEKGKKMVEDVKDNMVMETTDLSRVRQPHLYKPCDKPSGYDMFWEIYKKDGYAAVQKYMGNNTLKGKVKDRLVYIAMKLNLIYTAKKIMKK
ncbi:MAG: Coenzyme F420 hydrogenase/dehydrogenase, beta subunit C-terminal domain [Lachnospiraceae bacterium]|nr:Coenzyme F420 hydrogenase/dehydrogenase, beta subunit C-terminal domain [Lachnospiraceae bacterium]